MHKIIVATGTNAKKSHNETIEAYQGESVFFLSHNLSQKYPLCKYNTASKQYSYFGKAQLFNVNDLRSKLGLEKVTDIELLFKAYLKWGQDFPNHILGEWWLAVYDQNELFLARDKVSYTSLFYTLLDGKFYFSDTIKPLLSLRHRAISEKRIVARLLVWNIAHDDTTTDFKDIFTLGYGRHLVFYREGIKITKYWNPGNVAVRNYKNQDQYSEELFEIYKEAVANRIEGKARVASMLSGGIDSGSVCSMAAYILDKQGKNLSTYSHVPLFADKIIKESKHTFFDETDWILKTAGFYKNISPKLMDSEQISPIRGMTEYLNISEQMIHGAANSFWMFDLYQTVAKSGYDVLLSGEHGNAALSNAGVARLLPLSHPSFINHPTILLKHLLRPLYHFIKSPVSPKYAEFKDYYNKSFVNKHIEEKYDILNDVKANETGFGHIKYKNEKESMLMLFNMSEGRGVNGGNVSNYFNFNFSDPTSDSRLIEYCFSIPTEAFINKDGVNRYVVRKMMDNHMAKEVLYERKIGRQAGDILYRVLAHQSEMDETLERLFKSQYFNYIFNCKAIKTYWEKVKILQNDTSEYQLNCLLKAVMTGLFFERNNIG